MKYSINAPAKINIGLDVVRKRPDGYHDLKMIMQTIDIFDTVNFEILPAIPGSRLSINFSCNNTSLSNPEDNLVVKAIRLIASEFEINDTINVHLNKTIPIAAGMAGGSSDAAAVFIAMNDIYSLGLNTDELARRAVGLGADIPYCIMKGTALCEGIGDIITPITSISREIIILIVKPPINVSTGFVYGNLKLTPETVHPDINAIISAINNNDIQMIGHLLANVLETVTIPAYPIIEDIKKCMMENGAYGSLMSGSGPSVFGLFTDEQSAAKAGACCKKLVPGSYVRTARACK